jgi:hypothetical protein
LILLQLPGPSGAIFVLWQWVTCFQDSLAYRTLGVTGVGFLYTQLDDRFDASWAIRDDFCSLAIGYLPRDQPVRDTARASFWRLCKEYFTQFRSSIY